MRTFETGALFIAFLNCFPQKAAMASQGFPFNHSIMWVNSALLIFSMAENSLRVPFQIWQISFAVIMAAQLKMP
jgi:hypothetical protein